MRQIGLDVKMAQRHLDGRKACGAEAVRGRGAIGGPSSTSSTR